MSIHFESSQLDNNPRIDDHEEFVALCARFTCGDLLEDERRHLETHVAACPACSEVLTDYLNLCCEGLPAIAPEFSPKEVPLTAQGSIERVREELFRAMSLPLPKTGSASAFSNLRWQVKFWEPQRFLRYAAFLLLVASTIAFAYRQGEHIASKRAETLLAATTQPPQAAKENSIEERVNAFTRERESLNEQLLERDNTIDTANAKMNQLLSEISQLQDRDKALEVAIEKDGQEKTSLQSDRDNAKERLQLAQVSLVKTQDELANLRQQRASDALHATTLEVSNNELSARLKEQQDKVALQQDLLAADRNIRDLMGARDLYIAEVYDADRYGNTQKPFGRVFFTKNKSLIFYAYDLDQQPGVSNATTFQAWGQHGPDLKQAVSLGIFYKDSTADKRWVLKFDNPKTLQQLDSVFVTIEPNGGSPKPSNNRFMFAYLRMDANHP